MKSLFYNRDQNGFVFRTSVSSPPLISLCQNEKNRGMVEMRSVERTLTIALLVVFLIILLWIRIQPNKPIAISHHEETSALQCPGLSRRLLLP